MGEVLEQGYAWCMCVYDHVHVCVYKCGKSLTSEGGSTTITQEMLFPSKLFLFWLFFFQFGSLALDMFWSVLLFSHKNKTTT